MHLVIFGLGYSGRAVAHQAVARGVRVTATSRMPEWVEAPAGVKVMRFGDMLPAEVTHVLATAAPDGDGDPTLRAYGAALTASASLRWAGYLSTTGVYGDRRGGWVDEKTDIAPGQERSRRRASAEQAWMALARRVAVDLFRTAGIYGPGRSALDDVRSGRALRVVKLGHAFGRVHVEDIAGAVLAAMMQEQHPGQRILHLADDVPAESSAVIEEAARLLGVAPPPAVPFEVAVVEMSAMARSFWAENRKVASSLTQEVLGYRWRYPSYRKGLRAILAGGG